jgi:hypothetical protein
MYDVSFGNREGTEEPNQDTVDTQLTQSPVLDYYHFFQIKSDLGLPSIHVRRTEKTHKFWDLAAP